MFIREPPRVNLSWSNGFRATRDGMSWQLLLFERRNFTGGFNFHLLNRSESPDIQSRLAFYRQLININLEEKEKTFPCWTWSATEQVVN